MHNNLPFKKAGKRAGEVLGQIRINLKYMYQNLPTEEGRSLAGDALGYSKARIFVHELMTR